jgi:hypothetical protein
MRRFLVYQKCFRLIAVLLTGSWAFAADEVKVGLHKQLLVDDWVVAEKRGLVRELGTVVKQNGGKPIFEGHFYGTVLHDEGKFKMWYRGNPYGYAESLDGIHFNKISLLKGLDPAHHNTASFYIDPNETDPAPDTRCATPTCARTQRHWVTRQTASTGRPTTAASP